MFHDSKCYLIIINYTCIHCYNDIIIMKFNTTLYDSLNLIIFDINIILFEMAIPLNIFTIVFTTDFKRG